MFKIQKQSKCLSIDEWMRKIQWCTQSYLNIHGGLVPVPALNTQLHRGSSTMDPWSHVCGSTDLDKCSAIAYTEKTHI